MFSKLLMVPFFLSFFRNIVYRLLWVPEPQPKILTGFTRNSTTIGGWKNAKPNCWPPLKRHLPILQEFAKKELKVFPHFVTKKCSVRPKIKNEPFFRDSKRGQNLNIFPSGKKLTHKLSSFWRKKVRNVKKYTCFIII